MTARYTCLLRTCRHRGCREVPGGWLAYHDMFSVLGATSNIKYWLISCLHVVTMRLSGGICFVHVPYFVVWSWGVPLLGGLTNWKKTCNTYKNVSTTNSCSCYCMYVLHTRRGWYPSWSAMQFIRPCDVTSRC